MTLFIKNINDLVEKGKMLLQIGIIRNNIGVVDQGKFLKENYLSWMYDQI